MGSSRLGLSVLVSEIQYMILLIIAMSIFAKAAGFRTYIGLASLGVAAPSYRSMLMIHALMIQLLFYSTDCALLHIHACLYV